MEERLPRRANTLEATPYLGVLMVATATDQVSIGYHVAQQILVRPLGSGDPSSAETE